MTDPVYFYLPDFYSRLPLYRELIHRLETAPQQFYGGVHIGAVYGCFPGSLWNGGRFMGGHCTQSEARRVFEYYCRHGIPVRFTYSNSLIAGEALADPFCNMTLDMGAPGEIQVIVASDALEQYLRERHPEIPLISSTTKCITDPQAAAEELRGRYAMVVLDYRFNNTPVLESIPQKENCELLLNAYCYDDCPRRKQHYLSVDRSQLQGYDERFGNCDSLKRSFYELRSNRSFITVEQLYGNYVPQGFRHFKIEGRLNHDFDVLESLLYYLIRPEYRGQVRVECLKRFAQWTGTVSNTGEI